MMARLKEIYEQDIKPYVHQRWKSRTAIRGHRWSEPGLGHGGRPHPPSRGDADEEHTSAMQEARHGPGFRVLKKRRERS
jgi:hypothetical protein